MNLCPSAYDDYFLKDMVRKIEPRFKEEKLSKIFQTLLFDEYSDLMHRTNLFVPDTSVMLAPFSGKEDKLIEHFPDDPLSFRTQDLFKPFAVDRTYDIAFVSNILEYAKGNDEKLATCRDNLHSLLRSDGVVIATSFMNSSFDDFAKERDFFFFI